MNGKRCVLVAAIAAAAVGVPGRSETQQTADTATVLNPVVVTATKLPLRSNLLPSSVSVLEGRELRARGISSVHEALRTAAGLDVVQTSSSGSATSLFVRGGESDYVKVLLDGVPINLPGGAIDFADLTVDNIDRIEVVRGPTSVLYGSDAVAGVVQLFTARGKGPTTVNAGMRGGTYGSIIVDGDVAGGSEELGYSLGFSRAATDGMYEFNNQYDNLVVSGLASYLPDWRTDTRVSFRYNDSEYHYPTDGTGQVVDRNAYQLRDRVTVSLEGGRLFSDLIEGRFSLLFDDLNSGINDEPDGSADTVGFFGYVSDGRILRRSADLRANIHPVQSTTLTAGFQIEDEDERTFSVSSSEFGNTHDSLIVNRLNLGYYVQLQSEPVAGATLVAGLRLDDNDAFGSFLTYRGGLNYRFAFGASVRASVGKAFKEPTFLENYANAPFMIGNRDLVPERSISWEAGAEQRLWDERLVIGATYFDQQFRDIIQYTFATENPGDPNFMNVAAADASGVELSLRATVAAGFTLGGDYTYLNTVVTAESSDSEPGDAFIAGERLLRRPTNHVSAFGQYRFLRNRVLLGLRIDHVGDRDDRDFSQFPTSRVTLESYTRVDANAELKIVSRHSAFLDVTLTGRVENVFNKQYQEVVGFPARGRMVVVGGRAGF
ncbi:MAG: TonB-dependent receptor [Gemmatimonadota bacterium]|nr:MAG: TonB-dependent receptor [Gemmatimonadota bacterium]